jgi:hypothetical protein
VIVGMDEERRLDRSELHVFDERGQETAHFVLSSDGLVPGNRAGADVEFPSRVPHLAELVQRRWDR